MPNRPNRCPTCNSPSANRFPATSFEGEALGCADDWHLTDPVSKPTQETVALVARGKANRAARIPAEMVEVLAELLDPGAFTEEISLGEDEEAREQARRVARESLPKILQPCDEQLAHMARELKTSQDSEIRLGRRAEAAEAKLAKVRELVAFDSSGLAKGINDILNDD